MNKNLIYLLLITPFILVAYSKNLEDELSLPRKYWEYMAGYKYEYQSPPCLVTWSPRTASFLLNDKKCSELKPEKIKNDAIASINFLKNIMGNGYDFIDYYEALENKTLNKKEENKQAEQYPKPYPTHPSKNNSYDYIMMRYEGISIWMLGCADYALGYTSSKYNLNDTYQGKNISNKFGKFHSHMVKRIYDEGWKSAINVNFECHLHGSLFIDQYLLQVKDLRK